MLDHPIGHPSRNFPEEVDHGTALASLMGAVAVNRIGTVGSGETSRS